jgi:hypothetical protein
MGINLDFFRRKSSSIPFQCADPKKQKKEVRKRLVERKQNKKK